MAIGIYLNGTTGATNGTMRTEGAGNGVFDGHAAERIAAALTERYAC